MTQNSYSHGFYWRLFEVVRKAVDWRVLVAMDDTIYWSVRSAGGRAVHEAMEAAVRVQS